MKGMIDIERTQARLRSEGATAGDLAWLDGIGWDDAAVPPASAKVAEDYRRREAALNRAVAHLTFAERGESPEGRLAAAIGARLADLRDPEDEPAEDPDL